MAELPIEEVCFTCEDGEHDSDLDDPGFCDYCGEEL